MKKKIPLFICLGLFIMPAWIPYTVLAAEQGPVARTDPDQVSRTLEDSVNRAAETGEQSLRWQHRREQFIRELQDLELKDAWTRFQLEKMRRYISSEEKNIAVLKENLDRARQTRDALEPFLEVLYLDLETHVKNDLPFLADERERRLAFIRSALDDPNARISDKLRKLLDALQVESDYGYSVDLTQKIASNGENGPGQVTILRIGRLGLFRIPTGSNRIQRYAPEHENWQEIRHGDIRELKKAMEIARKKRVTTVVTLPVGNGGNE